MNNEINEKEVLRTLAAAVVEQAVRDLKDDEDFIRKDAKRFLVKDLGFWMGIFRLDPEAVIEKIAI
jgi:hypothetical protein